MKVKLSDIALEMGISVAAVSMAINNKQGVSDETREQVIQVAERLGYKIKPVKVQEEVFEKKFIKLLRIKKHGLVVMETAFFTAVIEGIESQCKKMGFEFLISNLTLNKEEQDQIVNEYHEHVEGMIVLCTELDEADVVDLEKIPCPVVILDRKFECNVDTILMNNEKACKQAVLYLVNKGHVDIGYLKSSRSIYNFESRFKSFREAIAMHQLPLKSNHIFELLPTMEGAYEDMLRLLEKQDKKDLPTAFIADNDIIALGAMNAMKQVGIKIPEEVSLIGIDDMPFCTIMSPQLTTVKVYKKEIGRQAVKMVVEKIKKESEFSRTVLVDTILIERESVKQI